MDIFFPFKLLFKFKKMRKEAKMMQYLANIQQPIKGSSNITPKLPIEKTKRISDLVD
ncbi:MAG: hypothetical protein QXH07_04650 [Thermoplasmata archaeon]